jgi:hypothetical protein
MKFAGLHLPTRAIPLVPLVPLVAVVLLLLPTAGHAVRLVEEDARVIEAAGGVDQVLEVPGWGYLVRDYNWQQEEKQKLVLHDQRGEPVRTISSFGLGPERYVRLKDVAVGADGTIWIADLSRLLRFSPNGEIQGTRLVQKPGYRVKGILLDEERDRLFLAGCLPTDTYTNRGCRLVHEYRLPEMRYVRSSVTTAPESIARNYLPLSEYDMAVDDEGDLWFVDAPVHRLVHLDPDTGSTRSLPIRTEALRSPEPVGEFAPENEVLSQEDASYLLDRLTVVGDLVVVSVKAPTRAGASPYLLQIFDREGRHLESDLEAPGRLVGTSEDGSLFFAVPRRDHGLAVARYRVEP